MVDTYDCYVEKSIVFFLIFRLPRGSVLWHANRSVRFSDLRQTVQPAVLTIDGKIAGHINRIHCDAY